MNTLSNRMNIHQMNSYMTADSFNNEKLLIINEKLKDAISPTF